MNDVDTLIPIGTRALERTPRPREDRVQLHRLVPLALPALALAVRPVLPAWLFMWVMAVALFLAAKWITVRPLLHRADVPSAPRLFAYCFLWPGMDPTAFFANRTVPVPKTHEWVIAAAKVAFGAALIWIVLPRLGSVNPLMAGWVGMVGLVLLLHFGSFHLLSLYWRRLGVDARPLMHSPALARSLSAFWGSRWNTAFRDLMHGHFLRALRRRFGAKLALFLVFLLSGFLHELVISLPAGGGYGLPTLYFATQGLGVLLEQSRVGEALGLRRGWKGRVFSLSVAGIPAFCLLHPVFIRNVILPMLHAIGAVHGTL